MQIDFAYICGTIESKGGKLLCNEILPLYESFETWDAIKIL
jgi:hypothetical protein